MKYYNEPERPLEPPEPPVLCTCSVCGWDIYEGEEYWAIEDSTVCEDCFSEFAKEYFENCRETAEKTNIYFEED